MNHPASLLRRLFALFIATLGFGSVLASPAKPRIVLLAGSVTEIDRVGHHDYLGGCRLLEVLLAQTPGVETVLVKDGWPADETVFDGADTIVFYTDGAGKQAYLETPNRVALIEKLAAAGTGIVSIHQAVELPPQFASQSMEWTGGFYSKALSARGHWDSKHDSFPAHPITRGVTAWEINDGWLNHLKFPGDLKGITPLVWSGKKDVGSSAGGPADVVGWAFDRADGGRSFSFSGLDAHSAWERGGIRKLIVNGILWTAGAEVPEGGAPCEADQATIDSFLTPRIAPPKKPVPTPKSQPEQKL